VGIFFRSLVKENKISTQRDRWITKVDPHNMDKPKRALNQTISLTNRSVCFSDLSYCFYRATSKFKRPFFNFWIGFDWKLLISRRFPIASLILLVQVSQSQFGFYATGICCRPICSSRSSNLLLVKIGLWFTVLEVVVMTVPFGSLVFVMSQRLIGKAKLN